MSFSAAVPAKLLQSCQTLHNPTDSSPPGSPVPGILQARTLKWFAISFSSTWKGKGKVEFLSHARLLATPWTAAYQAPPSIGFSKQEYWSGLPVPSPRRSYFKMWEDCLVWLPAQPAVIYFQIKYTKSWEHAEWGEVEVMWADSVFIFLWSAIQFSCQSEGVTGAHGES